MRTDVLSATVILGAVLLGAALLTGEARATSDCGTSLAPRAGAFTALGGSASVKVTATRKDCAWTAVSQSPFVHVVTVTSRAVPSNGRDGTGSGTVGYSVDPYPGPCARVGAILIAGSTFTVTQEGPPVAFVLPDPLPDACGGEDYPYRLPEPTGGCGGPYHYTASGPMPAGLSLDPSGTFVGTVKVSSSLPHTFRFSISAVDDAGNQTTKQATIKAYGYGLTPAGARFGWEGGDGAFDVTTGPCTWEPVVTSGDFIVIDSGGGTGSGTVAFSVERNASTLKRTGTISVGGRTFRITQSGAPRCTFALSPPGRTIGAAAASGIVFVVTARSGCPWIPTGADPGSRASWIHVTGSSPASDDGLGDGTVSYSAEANPGKAARTGRISIAGRRFTLRQEGSGTVTPKGYDGTYSGQFDYEYETVDSHGVPTGWTSASLTLTLTLRQTVTGSGMTFLDVTKAACSDPGAGCASLCSPNPQDISYAYLPADPPSSSPSGGIFVSFPNKSSIGTSGFGGVRVTAGARGWTLSNLATGAGDTWTPIGTIPTITNPSFDGSIRCTGWSITRQ